MKLENYIGAKNGNGVYQWILNHVPDCECFIELFTGTAVISRKIDTAVNKNIRIICFEKSDRVFKQYSQKYQDHGRIEFYHADSTQVLQQFIQENNIDLKKTVIYADPPYLFSVRRYKRKIYDHEWNEKDHVNFLAWIKNFRLASIIISGYDSGLYNENLESWNTDTFDTVTRKGPATEKIWFNFNISEKELLVTDHVGKNFRERQKIKQKVQNLFKKFDQLTIHERQMFLKHLQKHGYDISTKKHDDSCTKKNIDVRSIIQQNGYDCSHTEKTGCYQVRPQSIELFCGAGKISAFLKQKGFDTFTVDIRKRKGVCEPDLRRDILDLNIEELPKGPVSFLWVGLPCDIWSYAAGSYHWKNGLPNSEKCAAHLKILEKTLSLIDQIRPVHFFIENPRGKLRYYKPFTDWLQAKNGVTKTVTLSSYGFETVKPTNIFTNFHQWQTKELDRYGRGAKQKVDMNNMTKVQRQSTPVGLIEEIYESWVNYQELTSWGTPQEETAAQFIN